MSNNTNTKIFRQESINYLSSPEDLNISLSVINPSNWAILLSVLLILAGVIVWCCVGTFENTTDLRAEVSSGVARFKSSENIFHSGLPAKIADTDTILRDVGRDANGNFIAAASVPNMADGFYNARVVIERVSPLKFLFN